MKDIEDLIVEDGEEIFFARKIFLEAIKEIDKENIILHQALPPFFLDKDRIEL